MIDYKKLRKLRQSKKMKLKDVGLKIGVAESTVCQWELGNNAPSIDLLQKLAKLYEVSILELIKD